MSLPAPRAILFDWDNTLVNTWPVIHEAMVATFIAMGQEPWTLEETKAKVRKSMRDAFPALFGDDWEKAGEIYQQHYRAHHLGKLHPLPLSHDVLKRIKEMGLFCGVVSNKKGPTLRQEVEHIGWGPYFQSIIGSDDARRDKPHADPVHLTFDKSHIQSGSDVWFIGDSDIDLECAMNTGCTAILFGESAKDHPDYTHTHYQGFPYHAYTHDHAQVLDLLNAIEQ